MEICKNKVSSGLGLALGKASPTGGGKASSKVHDFGR